MIIRNRSLLVKCVIIIISALFVVTSPTVQAKNESGEKYVEFPLPEGLKLEMVHIPAGSFKMGSPKSEKGRSEDEGPVHKVTIGYDFYMGKYEITQSQWQAVMKTTRVKNYGIGPDIPVYYVSWDDCQEFVNTLNRMDLPGMFRLPTEAEWEYACRAGTKTRYYFGDAVGTDETCEKADAGTLPGKRGDYMWYCGNGAIDDSHPGFGAKPVGSKKPNAFGLYDMSGNVWEWCLDQYHPNYIGAPTDGRYWQDWEGTPKVLRGGAYDYFAKNCRSAVRCGYSQSRRYTFHGFRLVWLPFEKFSEPWFKTWEAEVIGDNMVSYQSDIGAWPKNMRMYAHGYQGEKFTKNWGTSIDNGTTLTQMDFLFKLYQATGKKRFKESFNKGLDWLLEAQYDNGGWPQRYPPGNDYGDLITFNDDAITNVMNTLRSIIDAKDSDMVNAKKRKLVKKAYDKGLECILACQQKTKDGQLTVWGEQHDPVTLEPRTARSYEPPALCGRESEPITLYLMSLENPSQRIIDSIEASVAWFDKNKLTGIRIVRKGDDIEVVKDPEAPAIWARFYEIGTSRPIFCGFDGVIKYDIMEIDKERRLGYSWYTNAGHRVLDAYPKWKESLKK